MISIIICSRYKDMNESLLSNIESTIGTDFELVWIDNSANLYGICGAYNEGVRRANGEYLCFMHDDVRFKSDNWGVVSIDEMNRSDVWMLGVVGSKYYGVYTPYWYYTGFAVGHGWCGEEHQIFGGETRTQDVVAVDGQWLFTRKSLFEKTLCWDADTYKYFDMYDMDICMQVISNGGKVRTMENVHIDHKSGGNFSPRFYEECKKFHKKWDSMLPVASMDITPEIKLQADRAILQAFIDSKIDGYTIKHSTIYGWMLKVARLASLVRK